MKELEKAARQALEALENSIDDVRDCLNANLPHAAYARYDRRIEWYREQIAKHEEAITALRQALEQQPAAWVGLTDDAIYAAAEIAWRAGWSACRDAEFVGEEAEDEAWGYQGATVAQDTEAKLREKNGGGV